MTSIATPGSGRAPSDEVGRDVLDDTLIRFSHLERGRREVLDASGIGVVMIDMERNVRYANRAALDMLGLAGFDYASSEEVRDELQREIAGYAGGVAAATSFAAGRLASMDVTRDVGIYRVDAIVRRSAPLQATAEGRAAAAPPGGSA